MIDDKKTESWYKKFREDAKSMVLVLMSFFIVGESTLMVYLINQNEERLDLLLNQKLAPAVRAEVTEQILPIRDSVTDRLIGVDTVIKELDRATKSLLSRP